MVFADLLEDVDYTFVLKNSTVCRSSKKPEPRYNCSLINEVPIAEGSSSELDCVAVKIALFAVFQVQGHADGLAENLFRIQRLFFADQLQIETRKASERFRTFQAQQADLVRTERGFNRCNAVFLIEGHSALVLFGRCFGVFSGLRLGGVMGTDRSCLAVELIEKTTVAAG
jgi:hypothetical protein